MTLIWMVMDDTVLWTIFLLVCFVSPFQYTTQDVMRAIRILNLHNGLIDDLRNVTSFPYFVFHISFQPVS
jgi:hypothetical protein